jgi:integrase
MEKPIVTANKAREGTLIKDLVPIFLDDRRQGCKPKTVEFYAGRLKRFVETFGARTFGELTLLDVTQYFKLCAESKRGKPVSNSTRRHNIVAYEQLQAFAVNMRELAEPITGKLKKPPIGMRQRIPTSAETRAILRGASPEFVRIYTALRLSGARPGELCRATIEDWDRAEGVIELDDHKTATKTGRPRVIPIGDKLVPILEAAIGGRTEGPIFFSPKGEAWEVGNLSTTFRRLRDAAGVTRELVLYCARHEAGTNFCRAGNLKAAADMLGHSSVNMTQRYVHLERAELRRLQDQVSGANAIELDEEPGEVEPRKAA